MCFHEFPKRLKSEERKVKGTFLEHSPYVIKMEPKNNLHGTFL